MISIQYCYALGFYGPSQSPNDQGYPGVINKQTQSNPRCFFVAQVVSLEVTNPSSFTCHAFVSPQSLRLSDGREGAREIRLYQDEVYTRLINLSCNLQKFQEGWGRYLLS